MDMQQMLAMVIVAAAALLLVRHYIRGKRPKAPACANCECGEGAGAPGSGPALKHPAKNGTFRQASQPTVRTQTPSNKE